jgi:hypothetical protein
MSLQPTFRPVVEPLEQRDLLSAVHAFVSGGNLYVVGAAGANYLQVSDANHRLSVTGIPITVSNTHVNSIDDSTINKVFVYGNAGNDYIDLGTVKNDAAIYCGDGNDTIRCGLGNDTVVPGGGFDRVFRPFVADQPAVNGVAVSDIRQGQNPLCQTDAALAEAVNQGENFAADIHYQGNDVYDVKLPGNTQDQRVYFDGWTTPNDPVETNSEFWPVLLQRARLQSLGIDPSVPHTYAQWSQLNQQSNGKLFSINDTLAYFTGRATSYQGIGSVTPQGLQASLASGADIVAQSQSGYVSPDGIIGNHTYALLAVYNDAGAWKVRLYNPWGMDRENGATIDSLDRSHATANDGFITLSWAQFTNMVNFRGIVVARR